MGKMLQSELWHQQAANYSKEQVSNSHDPKRESKNAIIASFVVWAINLTKENERDSLLG
jgi:hypothetical protein